MVYNASFENTVGLAHTFKIVTSFLDINTVIALASINKYVASNLTKHVVCEEIKMIKEIPDKIKIEVRQIFIEDDSDLARLHGCYIFRNVTRLIFDDDYNKEIEIYPSSVRMIRFGSSYNKMIKNLPTQLKSLHFGHDYDKECKNLPDGLKSIEFGCNYNQGTDNLPESLESIKFGEYYNQPTNNLPESVKSIKFGDSYNQPSNKLPRSLRKLEFGRNYNKASNNLPEELRELIFGSQFNEECKNLPKKLTKIEFGRCYNREMEVLPDTLKLLKVNKKYSWGKSLQGLPKSVEEVVIQRALYNSDGNDTLAAMINAIPKDITISMVDREYGAYKKTNIRVGLNCKMIEKY